MGFYGNITNASRTQFQFDRVYPSRQAMEAVQTVDGVYVGRYVLIEYDTDVHCDYYQQVWEINGKFYKSIDAQEGSELTTLNTQNGQIVRVEPNGYPANNAGTTKFYSIKHSNGSCIYTLITGNDSNYSSNYNIDLANFYGEGGGRGYDSTVWQKVYTEGIEKYVMVAELNTVVPTFDITADAPTTFPRLPHFDADSTNVYYKLHAQPQWGLRLKGAKAYQTPKLNDDGTNYKNNGNNVLIKSSSDEKVYPSDMNTIWSRHEYDRRNGYIPTYHASIKDNNLSWSQDEKGGVPAAVYFNDAGFNPDKVTYYEKHYSADSGVTPTYNGYNKISIEPTGRSGHKYSVHQAGQENECDIDIQELSIMLPGVGDAIAKLWDIVYGGENVVGTRMRNKDIYWNSVNGVRMVKENPNGEGYSYNSGEHISTVAGCINSVHDLMGMIIEKPNSAVFERYLADAKKASDNMIYYYNGRYYRKKKTYNYTALPNTAFEFKLDSNAQYNYKDGYYFTSNSQASRDKGTSYTSGTNYYEAYLKNALDFGSPVTGLINYEPNKYWTAGPASSWIKSTALTVNPDEIYYTLGDFSEVTIQNNYEPDRFYKIDNGNYILERSLTVPHVNQYYEINAEITSHIDYYNRPYEKNKYFYKEEILDPNTGTKTIYQLENADSPVEGRTYYTATIKSTGESTVLTKDEITGQYVEITVPLYTLTNVSQVNLFDITNFIPDGATEPVKFYYSVPSARTQEEEENEITPTNKFDYKLVTTYPIILGQDESIEGEDKNIYYTDNLLEISHKEGSPISGFFVPGGFYYPVSADGEPLTSPTAASEWRIDNRQIYTPDRKYFTFTATEIENIYRPGVYHYKVDEDYVLDNNPTLTSGRQYYLGSLYYVYEDTKKVFQKYSAWNNAVQIVPSSVELRSRTTTYTMEELTGFARTLNTIHGLILGVNDLIEFNDNKTRDNTTIQGCINQVNDIIAKFDKLIPERFLVVDDYGRVHNADFSTNQETTYNKDKNTVNLLKDTTGDKFALNASENGIRKQWISVNVDGDVDNPFIEIHHNFNPVSDRAFTSDKNSETRESADGNGSQNSVTKTKYGNNNSNSDDLILYNPLVDAMGHVVGMEKETLTLPYGYKYITTNGRGADSTTINTGTPTKETIVADSTQDTLIINSGNKWIRLDSTLSNDTLTISHDVHSIPDSAPNAQDLSSTTSQAITFTVPVYTLDAAGHFATNGLRTLTMPYGYGIVTGDTGTSTSSATFDTIQIASGDDWLATAAEKDKLIITHTGPVTGTATAKSNVTPAFGDTFTLEDWYFDSKGHKFEGKTHTVKIPTLAITDDTSGNVLTNIQMSSDNQKIEEIKVNVGTLALTGYAIGNSTETIAATDSINGAFAKLQNQLTAEVQARTEAISKEVTDRNAAIAEAITKEVADRNTAITNQINNLDKTDTAKANQYVSAVNQQNGIITVSRESLPDYSNVYAPLNGSVNTSTEFEYLGGATSEEAKTIEWLFKKVADLEGQIAILTGGTV